MAYSRNRRKKTTSRTYKPKKPNVFGRYSLKQAAKVKRYIQKNTRHTRTCKEKVTKNRHGSAMSLYAGTLAPGHFHCFKENDGIISGAWAQILTGTAFGTDKASRPYHGFYNTNPDHAGRRWLDMLQRHPRS